MRHVDVVERQAAQATPRLKQSKMLEPVQIPVQPHLGRDLVSSGTILWMKATTIRAIKAIAQTAVVMMPSAIAIEDVDWHTVISTALFAGVVSVLTSVTRIPESKDNSE
jgi:hypothetical protein